MREKEKRALVYARTALEDACRIIERGDDRLLAQDGPVNNQPPELSLKEWRDLYVILDRARVRLWKETTTRPTTPEAPDGK